MKGSFDRILPVSIKLMENVNMGLIAGGIFIAVILGLAAAGLLLYPCRKKPTPPPEPEELQNM